MWYPLQVMISTYLQQNGREQPVNCNSVLSQKLIKSQNNNLIYMDYGQVALVENHPKIVRTLMSNLINSVQMLLKNFLSFGQDYMAHKKFS